ncbi:hypothetical protein HCX50_17205 [Microbacterium oxydans]|uniref:hypothetical protein n=1 Tax=Microbacterium sp. B19(2022) TaxID=2914045 RepID=UPI00142F4518|nr:hypothetical protein [Microbacterium sp. B19(2022)]NJI61167.1 hypothetical protein [Microbacterium sp. B19(2022)]
MSDGPIVGQVAKLVSDREVILNRGKTHGIAAGDFVIVIDPETTSVADPETGEDLGGLKRIKAVLRVVEVADKLSLARTFRTRKVRVSGGMGSGGISNILAEPKYEVRVETLELDPLAGRPLSEDASAIATGDPFEVTTKEEAEDQRTVTLWR